jgi:hypothetical protein
MTMDAAITGPGASGVGDILAPTPVVTMDAAIAGPETSGSGHILVPSPVPLPAPAFANWQEAVDYARGMLARTRYLEGQIQPLTDAVAVAQIELETARTELSQLLDAARSLLEQGKGLA